jgi:uncharacterized protein (TIGR02466 family)
MSIQRLFPTLIYAARLQSTQWRAFNGRLRHECEQLRIDDDSGRRWSRKNYPGGYTSYNSVSRLHEMSPTFATLRKKLDRHVAAFVKSLELDLSGRALTMTDCWVNIMPRRVAHSWHLHPLSTISGTYYVQSPPGCAGLKFEDPRFERFMASPPRKKSAKREHQPWVVIPATTGSVVLFESWLRHEVPTNPATGNRISISFNYNWF